MKKIKIYKSDLERGIGAGSLVGLVMKELGEGEVPKVLWLSFEETDLEWRQKNNGCDSVITPEFTFACLAEDVVTLTQKFTIKIVPWGS